MRVRAHVVRLAAGLILIPAALAAGTATVVNAHPATLNALASAQPPVPVAFCRRGPDPSRAACTRLYRQPGYSYTYQGATVDVPDGPVLVDECMADAMGDGESFDACVSAWLTDYRLHNG